LFEGQREKNQKSKSHIFENRKEKEKWRYVLPSYQLYIFPRTFPITSPCDLPY